MAEISTITTDNEGITHLIGAEILDIRFVDVSKSQFANPDQNFTGYSADGFHYLNGLSNPAATPFKAAWASEGEHEEASLTRGTLDRFPDRIFVVTTADEVVILDADSLDVWMRFVPHSGTSSGSYGSLVGDSTIEINQADFIEGFLVVATSKGLRIADFRNDRAFVLDSGVSRQSNAALDLANRNEDEMAEGTSYTGSSVLLTHTNCLCVDVGIVGAAVDDTASGGGIVVAAVGHQRGLTGVRIHQSGAGGINSPQTKEHDDFETDDLGGWIAVDDEDGDTDTPYIVKLAGGTGPWIANEVRVGDILVLTPNSGSEITVTVISVTATRVEVTPEVSISGIADTYRGVGHTSHRTVPSVSIDSGGKLMFANGQQLVARVNEDWYASGVIDPRTGSNSTEIAVLHEDVTEIKRVRAQGGAAYVATEKGVFLASDSVFDQAQSLDFSSAELRYANPNSSLSATYEILEGDAIECVDVVIDPETGNILISAVDGTDCVLTEIDPGINQAFQFFDQDEVGGVVNTLVAYRNVKGPPDDESEVA